jgi:GT2 family glycosyltransferase
MAGPRLSVLIPTRGRAAVLDRCLDALARQRLEPERFEVVVCVDGSADDTLARLRARAAPHALRVVVQPPRGPAAARNRALAEARGELVLFANDDTIFGEDALAAHLAAHAQGSPREAVLGSFRLLPEHRRTPFGQLLDRSDLLFPFSRLRAGGLHDWLAFYTCNLSLGRALVEEAGGFDEGFALPACEDLELGFRLARRGVRVRFDPRCAAGHDHPLDVAGFCRLHETRGRGAASLFARHPETCPFGAEDHARMLADASPAVLYEAVEADVVWPMAAAVQTLSDRFADADASLQLQVVPRIAPLAQSLMRHFTWRGYRANPAFASLRLADRARRDAPGAPGRGA